MKRLWIAVGLLTFMLAAFTCSTLHLNQFIHELTEQLDQAQAHLSVQEWDQALSLTQSAYDQFVDSSFFLHTTLRHSDIDTIKSSFREVIAFLNGHERQPSEYAAANARLINQLELLIEAELPSLQNLL